jgi:hypothetical protein
LGRCRRKVRKEWWYLSPAVGRVCIEGNYERSTLVGQRCVLTKAIIVVCSQVCGEDDCHIVVLSGDLFIDMQDSPWSVAWLDASARWWRSRMHPVVFAPTWSRESLRGSPLTVGLRADCAEMSWEGRHGLSKWSGRRLYLLPCAFRDPAFTGDGFHGLATYFAKKAFGKLKLDASALAVDEDPAAIGRSPGLLGCVC